MSQGQGRRIVVATFSLAALDLLLVHDATWLTRYGTGIRFAANYSASCVWIACVLAVARASILRSRTGRALALAALAAPFVAELTHFHVYRSAIDVLGFDFAAQNKAETFSYFLEHAPVPKIVLVIAGLVFALRLVSPAPKDALAESESPARPRAPRVWAHHAMVALASAVALSLPPAAASNWYSVSLFQNGVFSFYVTWIEHLAMKRGPHAVKRPPMPKYGKGTRGLPNVIWVIGESAAKSHMGIYGYDRPTTPRLEALARTGRLLAFDDVVAVGNKTMLSVPYTLFGLEGPDPDGRIFRSPSIFNYAKARGLRTGFVSAQDIRWYRFDKLVVDGSIDTVLPGPEFASNVTVRDGADDLDVLEKGVFPFARKANAEGSPFFLVYQMNGSHYPYSTHSPARFKRFLPEGEPNSRNAYDNSIAYTDETLGALFSWVDAHLEDTWVFYVSDHGQDLRGGSVSAFHAGYGDAVIKPPMFAFHTGAGLATLRHNARAPLSQVDLFATTLDLLDVEPAYPIDGTSLFEPIPADRVRICSEFMPTFSNNPNAALISPGKGTLKLDFRRGQVTDENERVIMRIEDLDSAVTEILRRRM